MQRRSQGRKVRWYLISRSVKKAGLQPQVLHLPLQGINAALREAFSEYCEIRKHHKSLRETFLDSLATALSVQHPSSQQTILKQLREREAQRNVGNSIDITSKDDMEKAIMKNNLAKFQQSHHNPFYSFPLAHELGFKGISSTASTVLAGVYDLHEDLPEKAKDLLSHLHTPDVVWALGAINMDLSLHHYRKFWRKAKETTAAYSNALSFATMKAGASGDTISQIECALVNITLWAGHPPKHWKNFVDVMILKKSGVTTLSSLRTVALFPADCNFAFKHVGRQMMQVAEATNSLAKEQYGSRKRHRAVDLAVNKTLMYNILRQMN